MSGESAEAIQKHSRIYWVIGLSLLILTGVTVMVSMLDLGTAGNISLALFIATVKSSLVCCYFMHLISEKKLIYWILILTVAFFLILMFIPLLTIHTTFGTHLG